MEKNRKATKTKDIEKKKANQKTKEKKTKKKEKAKETAKATTKTSTTKTKTTKTKTTKKAQKVATKETKATSLRDALPVSSSLETSHKTTSRLQHQSKGEMETMEVIRMPGDYILYFQYVVSSKAGRFQCKKEKTSFREKWRRIH